jgi:transcription elongation factor Elf1
VEPLLLAFMTTCPRCNVQRSQSRYTKVDLDWLLSGDRPIDAHCSTCGESWALSDDDRARLANFLAVVHPARTAAG